MTDLLPCPFCGASDAFAEREDFTAAYVTCNHCSARGPVECQESDDEETPGKSAAEVSWNTRIDRAALAATPAVSEDEKWRSWREYGGIAYGEEARKAAALAVGREPVAWIVGNLELNFSYMVFFSEENAIEHYNRTKNVLPKWAKIEPVYAAPPEQPSLRGMDLDLIALDAAHQIEALPTDLHEAQKTARIQLIVLHALHAAPPEQPAATVTGTALAEASKRYPQTGGTHRQAFIEGATWAAAAPDALASMPLTGCLHPGNEANSCQYEGQCLSVSCDHHGKTTFRPRMTLEAQATGILYPKETT